MTWDGAGDSWRRATETRRAGGTDRRFGGDSIADSGRGAGAGEMVGNLERCGGQGGMVRIGDRLSDNGGQRRRGWGGVSSTAGSGGMGEDNRDMDKGGKRGGGMDSEIGGRDGRGRCQGQRYCGPGVGVCGYGAARDFFRYEIFCHWILRKKNRGGTIADIGL